MMRRSPALALALGLALARAVHAAPVPGPPPMSLSVPRVETHVTEMSWKGRTYRIFVSAPAGPPPAKGYPVLYVTDGNGLFDTAAQTAYTQAVYREFTGVDLGVVVAIGYVSDLPFDPRRGYDLSPPDRNIAPGTPVMRNEQGGTGGADNFLDFIDQSLKPALDRRYRIDHAREALFGHSRGGLFTLHALFTRPREFQTYIAASPAIWWHDGYVVKEEKAFLASLAQSPVHARLLITVGLDESGKTMVADAAEMARSLGGHEDRGLSVAYKPFEGENHLSVIPPALSRAVRFAFGDPAAPPPK